MSGSLKGILHKKKSPLALSADLKTQPTYLASATPWTVRRQEEGVWVSLTGWDDAQPFVLVDDTSVGMV